MKGEDGRASRLVILVAGPYRSGTNDDPAKMAENLLSADDPLTLAATALLLAAVAVVAGYVPARRPARIDPMECLRTE